MTNTQSLPTAEGDLIALAKAGEFDVIVHGCNCFNTMGAGFAKQLSEAFPSAKQADALTIKGDVKKLGNYSSTWQMVNSRRLVIVNAYTQYRYGRDKRHADYDAIKAVFEKIKVDFHGLKIAYPKIGADLAGGDWPIISEIIAEALQGEDHTYIEYRVDKKNSLRYSSR